MTRLLLFFNLLLPTGATPQLVAAPPPVRQTLAAARWQRRVVLVLAPTPATPALLAQKQQLAAAAAGLRERAVQVLYLPHAALAPADAAYLRQHYGLRLQGFEVVLIGKDGGVKLRRPQPVAPAELFGLIDQMPMRQQEMRLR